MGIKWNKDFKPGVHQGLLVKPKHIVLYPSYTLSGSHEDAALRDGHFVIENGWSKYEDGYHHKRDGAIWQVRKMSERGPFCPWAGIDTLSIGICLVGIPSYAPPLGSLPANPKYDTHRGKAVWVTERQMESLFALCSELCIKYDINPMHRSIVTPMRMYPEEHIPAIYQRSRVMDGFRKCPSRSECAFTSVIREEIASRMISLDF